MNKNMPQSERTASILLYPIRLYQIYWKVLRKEEACCRFAFALYRAVTACYNGSICLFLHRFVLPEINADGGAMIHLRFGADAMPQAG